MLESYNRLKQDVVSICLRNMNESKFFKLKNIFENELNSVRRLSYCKDLEGLIKLLEKADILNVDNVIPLKQIVKVVGNDHNILEHIQFYETQKLLETRRREPLNFRRTVQYEINNNTRTQERCITSRSQSDLLLSQNVESDDKIRNICFKIISEGLGEKWKEVGRALGIPEGEMDDIHKKHKCDKPLQILEMLQRYESNPLYERRTLRTNLEKALRKARRVDLALKITTVFDNIHN